MASLVVAHTAASKTFVTTASPHSLSVEPNASGTNACSNVKSYGLGFGTLVATSGKALVMCGFVGWGNMDGNYGGGAICLHKMS
jgi:hypothetical protein